MMRKSCVFCAMVKQQHTCAGKPPLFLQHQGHSRTIVGILRHRPPLAQTSSSHQQDDTYSLLLFDPSHRQGDMQSALHQGRQNAHAAGWKVSTSQPASKYMSAIGMCSSQVYLLQVQGELCVTESDILCDGKPYEHDARPSADLLPSVLGASGHLPSATLCRLDTWLLLCMAAMAHSRLGSDRVDSISIVHY